MQMSRVGFVALVGGAVLTILIFLFHPSHATQHDLAGGLSLSQVVHAAAIVAAPLILYGISEVGAWIRTPLARLGFMAGAIAMVMTVEAAVISSFVTPAAGRASASSPMIHSQLAQTAMASPMRQPMSMSSLPPLVQVTVSLNRGLAQAHVALLSIALLLFGIALWPRLPILAIGGAIVGAGPLAWQISGRFSPETFTMPIVIFPQCIWLIAVAVVMRRVANTEVVKS